MNDSISADEKKKKKKKTIENKLTSACNRCASCSVSNVTKPYPLLTPARSTMIFVDFTFPYDENTLQSSASVVSPLINEKISK